VVERHPELIHLLLADALRVPRQDLVLHLVRVLRDAHAQLLPPDPDRLHRVLRVPVLEDHRLLDLLVDVLHLVNVRLKPDQRLLHLLELLQLTLQTGHVQRGVGDLVVLLLDPRTAHVRLLREQNAQIVILLLATALLLEHLVARRHQVLHLLPLVLQVAGLDARVRVVVELQAVLGADALSLLGQCVDGAVLLVGLGQRGLELLVGVDQALDLVDCVHDEHVHEVLSGSVQPVVVWSCALGVLEEQAVYVLQDALGLLHSGIILWNFNNCNNVLV